MSPVFLLHLTGGHIRKGRVIVTLPSPPMVWTMVIKTRRCGGLLLKLSPHTCQTDQTKAKKQHGGGFGDLC